MNRKFKKKQSARIPVTTKEGFAPSCKEKTILVTVTRLEMEPMVFSVIEIEPYHYVVGGARSRRHITERSIRSQRSR